jgi:hypothetical protein
VVEVTLEVVEDALHISDMELMRVVHVKAHLLDRVYVRRCESEVLECPGTPAEGEWGQQSWRVGCSRSSQ